MRRPWATARWSARPSGSSATTATPSTPCVSGATPWGEDPRSSSRAWRADTGP
ncbi:unnamed protein product, partial [Prorocentrum cordatum]